MQSYFSIYTINGKLFTRHDDSIQICFDEIDACECTELACYIKTEKIRMISGKKECLAFLLSYIPNSELKTGYIFQLHQFDYPGDKPIELAKYEKQFGEISSLVCKANSENKSYYGLSQYKSQIYERYLQGYCKNWIYLDRGRIIGHIATYAETDKYVILGGLAVDEQERGKGIAKQLLSHSISASKKDNKDVYVFCYNNLLKDFYQRISINRFEYSKILVKKN